MAPRSLPLPRLAGRRLAAASDGALAVLTDDALFERTGTRIAFTERPGGASSGPFEGLNLSASVGDAEAPVAANIAHLVAALDAEGAPLLRPKQVHGTRLVALADAAPSAVAAVQAEAAEGADAVLVTARPGAALLCFADCLPLILVAPSGAFAVAHAGWRGAVARIASKAARELAAAEAATGAFPSVDAAASQMNAYIGPYIHSECFECGPDVRERFVAELGAACAPDPAHVDLGAAVTADLLSAGVAAERIADAGLCTACHPERFFSYRASGGRCGRHGAMAVRKAVG